MSTFTDEFPAPILDATKWTGTTVGTCSIVVGAPTDGIYPTTVDDDGDSVLISSDDKLIVPGLIPFKFRINSNFCR